MNSLSLLMNLRMWRVHKYVSRREVRVIYSGWVVFHDSMIDGYFFKNLSGC